MIFITPMLTKFTPIRQRVRMQLTGSVRHSELRLSHQAVAASRLAAVTLSRHSDQRPTLSAITRRALLDYAAKLEAMTDEKRTSEAHAVSRVSKALLPDAEAMQRANQALEAAEGSPAVPLPTLATVTCAPVGPSPAELEAAAIGHLKASMPRKYAHLTTL